MSCPTSRAGRRAGLGDGNLLALTDVIDAGLDLGPDDPARLVRIRLTPADHDRADADADDDELELGFRTVDDHDHPLDALIGFRAPADWAAIGVAAVGRALPIDDDTAVLGSGGIVRRRRRAGVPVRTVHLVDRSGAWASRWRPFAAADAAGADEDPADADLGDLGALGVEGGAASSVDTADVPSGRLDDALRRALGVPTAPPAGDTRLLWAVQWLDALLVAAAGIGAGAGAGAGAGGGGGEAASRRRRLRTLPALVAAHPAVGAFGLDPAVVDLERLVAEGTRLATWRSWAQLRRACARGTPDDAGLHPVPADLAAWLDDGAFARWVLADWPDLADLREALGELLAPAAVSVVDDALAGWGLS